MGRQGAKAGGKRPRPTAAEKELQLSRGGCCFALGDGAGPPRIDGGRRLD